MKPQSESALQRIRRVRHEISAACDHDPYKLVEYYIQLQERHRDRLVGTPEPRSTDQPAA